MREDKDFQRKFDEVAKPSIDEKCKNISKMVRDISKPTEQKVMKLVQEWGWNASDQPFLLDAIELPPLTITFDKDLKEQRPGNSETF
jgi:hypothetical protein